MKTLCRSASPGLLLWAVCAGLALLAIVGFHVTRELDRLASPPSESYSRALALGRSEVNTAPAVIVQRDGAARLAWSEVGGFAVSRILPSAVIASTSRFTVRSQAVRDVRLAGDWVLWRNESDGALTAARLDGAASRLLSQTRIAGGVLDFTLVDARYLLAATQDGLVGRVLDGPIPRALIPPDLDGVVSVDAVLTRDGALHAGFLQRLDAFNYAILHASLRPQLGWSKPSLVAKVPNLDRGSLSGLRLGLDRSHVYFFYARDTYRPRKTTVYYLSHPLATLKSGRESAPKALEPRAFSRASQLGDPSPAPGQADELAVGLTATTLRPNLTTGAEVVVARFRSGRLVGGDYASRAKGAVLQPRLAVAEGSTYVAFLETAGFGDYRVRLASSSAGFRATLNRLTRPDILGALLNAWLGMFSVFGMLFYFSGTWIPAFIGMTLCSAFAITWAERNPGKTLAISLAVYAIGKVWTVATTFYTPAFAEAMPTWLAHPSVGCALSLGILALAVVGLRLVWRENRLSSPFGALAFAGAVDTLLTLFLYAPFLG